MRDRPFRVAVDARCLNTEHLRGIGQVAVRAGQAHHRQWRDRVAPVRRSAGSADARCRSRCVPGVGVRNARLSLSRVGTVVAAARRGEATRRRPAACAGDLGAVVATGADGGDHSRHHSLADDRIRAWPPACIATGCCLRRTIALPRSSTSQRHVRGATSSRAGRALQQKLHVISPGVDERYLEAVPDRRPIELGDRFLTEPYLLYLGGADPRKRLMWALQAWWGAADSGCHARGVRRGTVRARQRSQHGAARAAGPPDPRAVRHRRGHAAALHARGRRALSDRCTRASDCR